MSVKMVDDCTSSCCYWRYQVLDTLSGDTWELAAKQGGGETRFSHYFDGCESVLFHLTPGQSSDQARSQTVLRKDYKQVADVSGSPIYRCAYIRNIAFGLFLTSFVLAAGTAEYRVFGAERPAPRLLFTPMERRGLATDRRGIADRPGAPSSARVLYQRRQV